jgi:hypothetical protein
MRNLVLISSLFVNYVCYAQSFGNSQSCHININNQNYWIDLKKANIEATFKLRVGGNCTATLVNRNVPASELGNYFVTAKHCISDIDFTKNHYLYFNYQSPTSNSDETILSNKGIITYQLKI